MTRPELFVFIALSVGWLSLAAWAFRIATKLNRLRASLPKQASLTHREPVRENGSA